MGFLEADDIGCLGERSDVVNDPVVPSLVFGLAGVEGKRSDVVEDDLGVGDGRVEGSLGSVNIVETHLLRSEVRLASTSSSTDVVVRS